MGAIEKLGEGSFRARWRDPDGRRKSRSFKRERDARRFLADQQNAMQHGTYIDDAAGKITFAEWAEHYFALASKRLARTSYARDVTYLNSYILPRWGRSPLTKITKADVERWVVELAADGQGTTGGTLAPGTVEKIYQTFRKVMRAAMEDDRIARLPCPEHPPIARRKHKAVRFIVEAEVQRLALAIAPRYSAMIYVAAYGGFRIGELCALRLDDVDWEQGYIRVDEGLTDVDGRLEFECPKTSRGRRIVPMADLALERLKEHIEQYVGWGDPTALLFTGRDGAVVRPSNWRRRHFNPASIRSGLAPLTPHHLRHTAASLFIAEGANPWMLAEILGHRDTRMIDLVYGHLFEKDRQALRLRMSRRAKEAAADNVRRLPRRIDVRA